MVLNAAEASAFWQGLADFEEWVSENKQTDMDILGNILSVKPLFYKKVSRKKIVHSPSGGLNCFQKRFFGQSRV